MLTARASRGACYIGKEQVRRWPADVSPRGGINDVFDPDESSQRESRLIITIFATTVECQGIDPDPFTCRVAHADKPGEYCFPPVASRITSAARLMLALLERAVSTEGGTYAMEDTDSMAIVSTEEGGLVPCPGGTERTSDGHEAIRALSWSQVHRISERFRALNPYDPSAIAASVLEIEKDNFDPITGHQRQLWCFAVSAKRYALFLRSPEGEPILLKGPNAKDKEDRRLEFLAGLANNENDRWSEHGLGQRDRQRVEQPGRSRGGTGSP